MPSSIFGNVQNSASSAVDRIKGMMGGMDPRSFGERMVRENPAFARFVEQNRGKSPEQICRDNGIDFSNISKYLR